MIYTIEMKITTIMNKNGKDRSPTRTLRFTHAKFTRAIMRERRTMSKTVDEKRFESDRSLEYETRGNLV